MEYAQIEKKVKDIIEDICGEQPTLEQNLRSDLKIDSLEKVEIVMAIEKEFGFDVEDSEFDGIQTVQQVVNLVNRNIDAGVK